MLCLSGSVFHGPSIHQSRAHKSQDLVSELVDKVIDDGLMGVSSQVQANSNGKQVQLEDYINKTFPGAVIRRVVGDGACGSEDHWRELKKKTALRSVRLMEMFLTLFIALYQVLEEKNS